ncbi:phosphoglycerate mutase-like protein [Meredithblackwellia eburnea MCA 4105]
MVHDESDLEASVQAPLLSKNYLEAEAGEEHRAAEEVRHSCCTVFASHRWFFLLLGGLFSASLVVGWFSVDRTEEISSISDARWPTDVGYAGPTPTGSEAFAAATNYPKNTDKYPLHPPSKLGEQFLYRLGNLSPWRSVSHGLATDPEIPKGCTLDQIHLLHRHGARYPTSGAGPADFARRISEARGWKASGELEFLNRWTYQLGAEILTPFGREQLFNLGTGFRVKYGRLLDQGSGKPRKKPVFRTESQDRMLKSALNFAAGFFGIPFEDQYHQLITIESPGFNNTLAPYMTCKNANRPDLNLGKDKLREWISIYLKDTLPRIQALLDGFELTLADVFNMQTLAAYEIVALSGSSFADLFTEEEWDGFEYAWDLIFWYGYSFGNPAQAAVGLGWVQEWIARVTKTPIETFNSTTNATLHTPDYFPLDQRVYVDATHDTIISAVLTTLQFSTFASTGPLPSTHIPQNRSFDTAKISPFAANLQSQILTCDASVMADKREATSVQAVRWILNDGVVPLDNIDGCSFNEDGLCELSKFLAATTAYTSSIDWAYDCLHPYELGNVPIVDGRPSSRPQ